MSYFFDKEIFLTNDKEYIYILFQMNYILITHFGSTDSLIRKYLEENSRIGNDQVSFLYYLAELVIKLLRRILRQKND